MKGKTSSPILLLICTTLFLATASAALIEDMDYGDGMALEVDSQPTIDIEYGDEQDNTAQILLDCLIGGNAGPDEYSDWDNWDKPDCWCYKYQCRGDIDGLKIGLWEINAADLYIFRTAFFKPDPELATIPNGICADLDHKKIGLWRVNGADLTIFRTYAFYPTPVPHCNEPPIYTGPYNFWTSP